jgi:hypothetical protein
MQIILLDKIANLGNLGDVVKVKDGYARNFLIPTKRARRATEVAIKEFEARRAELEKAAAEKLSAAQALSDKLNGKTVRISQKAGVAGPPAQRPVEDHRRVHGFGGSAHRRAVGCDGRGGRRNRLIQRTPLRKEGRLAAGPFLLGAESYPPNFPRSCTELSTGDLARAAYPQAHVRRIPESRIPRHRAAR